MWDRVLTRSMVLILSDSVESFSERNRMPIGSEKSYVGEVERRGRFMKFLWDNN